MTGRFHDRTYQLGEKMAWWPPSDRKYSSWRHRSDVIDDIRRANEDLRDQATECCYAECRQCGARNLFALLRFDQLVPELLAFGPEEDWPEGHYY